MEFHRQILKDFLRNGTIIRSTMLGREGVSQSYQTFIPNEDFGDKDELDQQQLIWEAYELIEGKLRDLGNAA